MCLSGPALEKHLNRISSTFLVKRNGMRWHLVNSSECGGSFYSADANDIAISAAAVALSSVHRQFCSNGVFTCLAVFSRANLNKF